MAALGILAWSKSLGASNRALKEPTPQGKSAAGVAGNAPRPAESGWKLAWQDDFRDARCPDPAKWSFEHGFVRNVEDQWYQRRNARCQDGLLEIVSRRAERPNPDDRPGSSDWRQARRSISYTSASLTSNRAFTYGRFEMRARIDPRWGSWPAFWTLGTAYRSDRLAWPRSGEVDIMEYYKHTVRANVCKPRRFRCGWSSVRRSLADLGGEAWPRRFHIWRMDWSPQRIELFLDGRLVNRFPVAPCRPLRAAESLPGSTPISAPEPGDRGSERR